MALQDIENSFGMPAGVAKLYGHAHPRWHSVEKVLQPGVISDVTWPQLNKKHASAITEFVPTGREAL